MHTILVVDDSPVSRRILSHTLQHNGYTVLSATNGLEALSLIQERDVDLVIADLAMPEMDGLTLLRHLRADNRFCDLRIIMLTASGQETDRLEAEASGVQDFLTKPTSSRDLLATVSTILN